MIGHSYLDKAVFTLRASPYVPQKLAQTSSPAVVGGKAYALAKLQPLALVCRREEEGEDCQIKSISIPPSYRAPLIGGPQVL